MENLLWQTFFLMVLATSAYCSHFRGGIIKMEPRNDTTGTYKFVFKMSWRTTYYVHSSKCQSSGSCDYTFGDGSLLCRSGCSGNLGSLSVKCTDCSISGDWSTGSNEFVAQLPPNITMEASFTGGDWISGVGGNWELRVKMNTTRRNGVLNTSPITAMTPIVVVQGNCNKTIKIPVEDKDGDVVRCRWAESNKGECASVCRKYPGTLRETECELQWTATATSYNYYKPVALQVEDFETVDSTTPLSSVPLQFLVQVIASKEPCSSGPVFLPPTRRDGSCIGVAHGTVLNETAIVEVGTTSDTVTEFQTQSPGDLTRVLWKVGPKSWGMTYSWTPAVQDYGPKIFCFKAIDNHARSTEQRCVTLLAGVPPPKLTSVTPKGEVLKDHSTWTVEFDMAVTRPNRTTYVDIHLKKDGSKVYRIDVSNPKYATFEFRRVTFHTFQVFIEKEHYYITFEDGVAKGKLFCGPESYAVSSSTFWTFHIKDTTPPLLTCRSCPHSSKGNVTFIWSYNEQVNVSCKLLNPQSVFVTAHCTGGGITMFNLLKGRYVLFVEAKDQAGNVAAAKLNFYIDTTAPTVENLVGPNAEHNASSAQFKFSCRDDYSPSCTYQCSLETVGTSRTDEISCTSGYTSNSLQNGQRYKFHVKAVDGVGNVGQEKTLQFRVDTEPPVMQLPQNVTISCGDDDTPGTLGKASATDNIGLKTIVHEDTISGNCQTSRIWLATDLAGNTARGLQTISYNGVSKMTVTADSLITIPCVNASTVLEDLKNWKTYIKIVQNCPRKFLVVYKDNPELSQCNSQTDRVWEISDDCGHKTLFQQTLRILPADLPLFPANGAVGVNLRPRFVWNAYPFTDHYIFSSWQVDMSAANATKHKVYSTSLTAPNRLKPNTKYFWKLEYILKGSSSKQVPSPTWGFQTQPVADLAVEGIAAPSTAFTGENFAIKWKVRNIGKAVTQTFTWWDNLYLGKSTDLRHAKQLKSVKQTRILSPNDGYSVSVDINLRHQDFGTYFVFVNTDVFRNMPNEIEWSNNLLRAAAPIEVQLAPPPDLTVSRVTLLPESVYSGESLTVKYKVTNAGDGILRDKTWYDKIYINTKRVTTLKIEERNDQLLSGGSYENTIKVPIPHKIFGDFNITVFADSSNTIFENLKEDNNEMSAVVKVRLTPPPDFIVTKVTTNSTLATDDILNIQYTVKNDGLGEPFETYWYDGVFLVSPYSVVRLSTLFIGGPLKSGQSYNRSLSYKIPPTLASGDYVVMVRTNENKHVFEYQSYQNNEKNSTVRIVQKLPDFIPVIMSVRNNVTTKGNIIDVTFEVKNIGYKLAQSRRIRMSVFARREAFEQTLSTFSVVLSTANSTTGYHQVAPPLTLYGDFDIGVQVNWGRGVLESDFRNNVAVKSLSVPDSRPELMVANLETVNEMFSGQTYNFTWDVQNIGKTDVPLTKWSDGVYYASDSSRQKINLGRVMHHRELKVGGSYHSWAKVKIPESLSGWGYILIIPNDDSSVVEKGSREAYRRSVKIMTPATPDLVPLNIWTKQEILGGVCIMTVNWLVENKGNSFPAELSWTDGVRIQKGTRKIQRLQNVTGLLKAQGQYRQAVTMSIPAGMDGEVNVVLEVDVTDTVQEGLADDNNKEVTKVTIADIPAPVLTVTEVKATVPPLAGERFNVSYTVKNEGARLQSSGWQDGIYYYSGDGSSDDIVENGILLATVDQARVLESGTSYTIKTEVSLPPDTSGAGNFYVIPRLGSVRKGQEDIKIRHGVGNFTVKRMPLPNLVAATLPNVFSIETEQPFFHGYNVTNVGRGRTLHNWWDKVYLSKDPVPDVFDRVLKSVPSKQALGTNQTYNQSVELRIPGTVISGQYYLIVETGVHLMEVTTDDNFAAKPIVVKQLPPSDLSVVSVKADKVNVTSGEQITLEWTLANEGMQKTHGYKCDNQYLSRDTKWDIDDLELREPICSRFEFDPFQSKQKTYKFTSTSTVPFTKHGDHFGLVTVRSNVYDVNMTNNEATTATLRVSVPILKLGLAEKVKISSVQERVFRIPDVPAESALIVTLEAPPSSPYHNLFLKKDETPSTGDYDVRSTKPSSISQTIVASNSAEGDFYLLVTNSPTTKPYEIQLLAKLAVFEIHSVGPLTVATGSVTFRVTGALFSAKMKANLIGANGKYVTSTHMEVTRISEAYITFEINEEGKYKLELHLDNKKVTNVKEISVKRALPPGEVSVQLQFGRALRIGEDGVIDLIIGNPGYSDYNTPVFLITAGQDGEFRPLHQPNMASRNEWLFLGPTTSDYWRSLPPRSTRKYSFQLPSPSTPKRLDVKVLLISDSNFETIQGKLISQLRETRKDLNEREWGALWQTFIESYGENLSSWTASVLDIASEQLKYKRYIYDFREGLEFMLNLADGITFDKTLNPVYDVWEPTAPHLFLTRKYSLRSTVGKKVGYFGVGWISSLLDFELMEMTKELIILLVEKLPVHLVKIGDVFAGQGYSAEVIGNDVIVTSSRDNRKYVLSIQSKRVVKVLHASKALNFTYSDSEVNITDTENVLKLHMISHAGYKLCQRARLLSPKGTIFHSIDYSYEANSPRLVSVTSRTGAVKYEYNASGRLMKTAFPNMWSEVMKYNSKGVLESLEKVNPSGAAVTTETFVISKGSLKTSVLGSGVTSVTTFDTMGRQIAFRSSEDSMPFYWESSPKGDAFQLKLGDTVLQSGSKDRRSITGSNANRGHSKMTEKSDGVFELVDAASNVFLMEYDDKDRLQKYKFPDGRYESYTYDAVSGLMAKRVGRDGQTTTLTYDQRGRVTDVALPDGFLSTEYTHPERGNLARRVSNRDDIIKFEYDANERPISIEHADGHVVEYTWNSLSQISSVETAKYSVSYEYNDHGQLTRVKDIAGGNLLGQFEYAPQGQLLKKTLGNGDFTQYTYDKISNRVLTLKNFYKNGTVASSFTNSYNRRGQRVKMETNSGTWTYSYDAGGELVGWTDPTGAHTEVEYDKVMNRLAIKKGKISKSYKHNTVYQMTQEAALKLQYDENGNLMYKENGDGSRLRMKFNSINQLVWLDNDTFSCNFQYDPLGSLMSQNCSDGSRTRYISDSFGAYGYNILARIRDGKQENFYYASNFGLLSAKDDMSKYFFHFDPDFSTVAVTDAASKVLNTYQYTPFGEDFASVEGWLQNPFRYRGQLGVFKLPGRKDKYLARARIYDPTLGRFISMDPYHHTRQGTTNPYAYCNNNPIECKDPNGEWLQFVAGAALIGGIANAVATTGWNLYQGMSNGKSFTESLPSLGQVAGSFVSGAVTGAAIAGGALPGAMAGTTFVGGFAGGALGTAIENAIDGKAQNPGSIVYNGVLNGLGAMFLPPGFIGPYSQHLNNMVKHSYLYWITRNSFGETMKRFWKPFAGTFGLGSALGIFAGNLLDKLWSGFQEWVQSRDPNDIIGPAGYGDLNFIPPDLIGRYKIRFENVANASAPAQKVTIRAEISGSIEMRTFRLGPIGFGNKTIDLDFSQAMHRSARDLTPDFSYAVRVQAGIDVIEHAAWWELTTVNASTGELIPDPLIGFLPPNNNASDGEGYVMYEVGLKQSLPHMTKVKAKAVIVFDQNEEIETPEIFNTIDATKPTSSLIVDSNTTEPILRIEANDTGASVGNVNLYKVDANGTLSVFLKDLKQDSVMLLKDLPTSAGSVNLISIAKDNVGNEEDLTSVTFPEKMATVSFNKTRPKCPDACSGHGNCSKSGICVCHIGYIGLNCSENGTVAEPPVLQFWVGNTTAGESSGFVGYRLLEEATYQLRNVKLTNISVGIHFKGLGASSNGEVILKPEDIGNFTLTIFCHSRVGWHTISALYDFEPFAARRSAIARFYVSHAGCQSTTTPAPTRPNNTKDGATTTVPSLYLILVSLILHAATNRT